ncbi:hypothetical protein CD351_03865 [Erythrobacter sp. KY5]|uniref:hypothetical protein n=1 Tax=Erythrobacter sp. KY5 TaxID=2011159 RepID=UPI000DBF0BE2|nr:hypothetical protein [Erythrobacter sp. KY5]AWW73563.1 hypothetical protein CD351_03865 [Erythrobacter sp. KY5]
MLANIARREAMTGYAEAVREEGRSHALATRSRRLLDDYSERPGGACADDLRDLFAFKHSLGMVASQAEEARRDAAEQLNWHSQVLAAAAARADASDDRLSAARLAFSSALERREEETPRRVARKLQSEENEAVHQAAAPDTGNCA